MTWERLPALLSGGLRSGCLCCGSKNALLAPDALVAVGFGRAAVTRDGEEVWSERARASRLPGDYWTCRVAERFARSDPDHDWRIVLEGPLSGAWYQRHGVSRWVLIHLDRGFA